MHQIIDKEFSGTEELNGTYVHRILVGRNLANRVVVRSTFRLRLWFPLLLVGIFGGFGLLMVGLMHSWADVDPGLISYFFPLFGVLLIAGGLRYHYQSSFKPLAGQLEIDPETRCIRRVAGFESFPEELVIPPGGVLVQDGVNLRRFRGGYPLGSRPYDDVLFVQDHEERSDSHLIRLFWMPTETQPGNIAEFVATREFETLRRSFVHLRSTTFFYFYRYHKRLLSMLRSCPVPPGAQVVYGTWQYSTVHYLGEVLSSALNIPLINGFFDQTTFKTPNQLDVPLSKLSFFLPHHSTPDPQLEPPKGVRVKQNIEGETIDFSPKRGCALGAISFFVGVITLFSLAFNSTVTMWLWIALFGPVYVLLLGGKNYWILDSDQAATVSTLFGLPVHRKSMLWSETELIATMGNTVIIMGDQFYFSKYFMQTETAIWFRNALLHYCKHKALS